MQQLIEKYIINVNIHYNYLLSISDVFDVSKSGSWVSVDATGWGGFTGLPEAS